VQRNLAQLRADGVILLEPDEGRLSCGDIGAGRMAEPERIFKAIAEQLGKKS
jgi:phosphopantothenoylcysteine decarboxylase/phosphopantothenate--cysteine ligase